MIMIMINLFHAFATLDLVHDVAKTWNYCISECGAGEFTSKAKWEVPSGHPKVNCCPVSTVSTM